LWIERQRLTEVNNARGTLEIVEFFLIEYETNVRSDSHVVY
jgi:hypothetical protein